MRDRWRVLCVWRERARRAVPLLRKGRGEIQKNDSAWVAKHHGDEWSLLGAQAGMPVLLKGEGKIQRSWPREIRAGRKLRAGCPSFLRTSRQYERKKAKSKEPARRRRYGRQRRNFRSLSALRDDNPMRPEENRATGGPSL
jgi:hypothetical protein